MKLGGKVGCDEEIKSLQMDIDRLGEWARIWQMEFNVDKCEVIHFSWKNKRANYYLNGKQIQKASVQRDLGVLAHESQNMGCKML